MKLLLLLSIVFMFLLLPIQDSFSELEISTNSKVYSSEHTLQVFGQGLPEENLILRLFAPDESITKFEQIQTNSAAAHTHLRKTNKKNEEKVGSSFDSPIKAQAILSAELLGRNF